MKFRYGVFFLASGGGPKGKKKGQPHLPWIFQNGSLSPSSSASLTPLSVAAAHPKIMQYHHQFPCITKSQNRKINWIILLLSINLLLRCLCSLVFSLIIVVVDSRRRCLLP
jgi:hypothetical protein